MEGPATLTDMAGSWTQLRRPSAGPPPRSAPNDRRRCPVLGDGQEPLDAGPARRNRSEREPATSSTSEIEAEQAPQELTVLDGGAEVQAELLAEPGHGLLLRGVGARGMRVSGDSPGRAHAWGGARG